MQSESNFSLLKKQCNIRTFLAFFMTFSLVYSRKIIPGIPDYEKVSLLTLGGGGSAKVT